MRAVGDDNIDWDMHALHAPKDPFTQKEYFDYFAEYIKGRVLDLGCSIGRWCPLFRSFGIEYEGLDFSEVAIKIARKTYPDITFHLMKAEDMDFEERYDLVFTHTVLQHINLENKKSVIAKVWRALKRDGVFVIEEKSDIETATTFTKEGWIAFIAKFGFEIHRCTGVGDPRNGYVFRKVGKLK